VIEGSAELGKLLGLENKLRLKLFSTFVCVDRRPKKLARIFFEETKNRVSHRDSLHYHFLRSLNNKSNDMASFNPTQIFDDGTTEEKGENARLSAFVGAIAVGDLGTRAPNFSMG
jgi:hypothetical protein